MSNQDSLWTFDIEVIYWQMRFWLVEWCVLWNGERIIMEMVELTEGIDGYETEE